MMREYYICPDCGEQRMIIKKKDGEEFYCCEACERVYEAQEWDDLHNYLEGELESYYSEDERGETWDKED